MKPVIVYTGTPCPYCERAKALLKKKGVAYDEIDVSRNDEERIKMMERANGRRTVPQIFIGETHIGGCDDLYALESQNKLDALLAD